VIKTASTDGSALTVNSTVCISVTDFRLTWARGMNKATIASTDRTPTEKAAIRVTG
jgi:hypothetical protein